MNYFSGTLARQETPSPTENRRISSENFGQVNCNYPPIWENIASKVASKVTLRGARG
jgi:hypothetical protein